MALHVSTVVVPIDFSVASTGAIETALEIVDIVFSKPRQRITLRLHAIATIVSKPILTAC
jgi:hypothetical protein